MNDVNSKPTQGPWRVAPSSSYRGSEINIDAGPNGTGGFICVAGHRGDLEAEANAALIAEAGTVLYETGLTPQQLREQRDELLAALKDALKLIESEMRFAQPAFDMGEEPADKFTYDACPTAAAARAAIAKVEQSK